jgi:translation initiation factor IF-2
MLRILQGKHTPLRLYGVTRILVRHQAQPALATHDAPNENPWNMASRKKWLDQQKQQQPTNNHLYRQGKPPVDKPRPEIQFRTRRIQPRPFVKEPSRVARDIIPRVVPTIPVHTPPPDLLLLDDMQKSPVEMEPKSENSLKWQKHKKHRHLPEKTQPVDKKTKKVKGRVEEWEDDVVVEKQKKKTTPPKIVRDTSKDIYIPQAVTVSNLARLLNVRYERLVTIMKRAGLQHAAKDHILSGEEVSLVVLELDLNPIVNNHAAFDLYPRPKRNDPSLPSRPPVVTIMGHVDHGKTTLLDALRKSSVAAGEAGGITQHIGAFSVQLSSKDRITFLDTPGHAAFSAMRARGANVTDIVVLVVAADDGIMPQTVEAIQHAQAANVPMILAITKCDKHDADMDKIKNSIVQHGIHLEEIGGDVQAVHISAVKGEGLVELEECIHALSEALEITCDAAGPSEGVVIESMVDRGLGNVATVLVQHGTLKVGDHIVAGTTWCKVRSLLDETGASLKQATPGMPVKVSGWKELPEAGDEALAASDEEQAKLVVDNRLVRITRHEQIHALEEINEKRRIRRTAYLTERKQQQQQRKHQPTPSPVVDEVPQIPELPVIVKGDVTGTTEAVVSALEGIPSQEARIKVVHSGVGNVTESDVDMAAACQGTIFGFNVKIDKKTLAQARLNQVHVVTNGIIYRLLEEAKERLVQLLPKKYTSSVVGEAKVLQLFEISGKRGMTHSIAGCRVTNGTIKKNESIRVVRDGTTLFDGKVKTLKHVKKDVEEASKGLECGIQFEGFTDIREGDVLQTYTMIELERSL